MLNTLLTLLSAETIQHYTNHGFWGTDTSYDLVEQQARRDGDRHAVRDRHQRLTYRQLLAAADAFARDLDGAWF